MNIEQLHYVKVVAETGSITVAATRLFVTQSAISQSIVAIEKELGTTLFHRSRRGTTLTDDGKWIVPRLTILYQQAQELKLDIQARNLEVHGQLRIATIPGVFLSFLPQTLATLKQEYAGITFQLDELENRHVFDKVVRKEADVGFIGYHSEVVIPQELTYHSLQVTSSYYLIVPAQSRFSHLQHVRLQDILEESFILYGDYFFFDLINDLSSKAPNIIFKSLNSEVIKKSVLNGLGVSIFTSSMIEEDQYFVDGLLKGIPLIGEPFHNPIEYGFVYEHTQGKSIFIQLLTQVLKKQLGL